MRLGFIALLSRALGDSLNPDCTARACRMPRLFMSILVKRLHPAVVASADRMSSTSVATPIIGEHVTNQNEHLTNQNEHLANLLEHLANLESRWTSMLRS